MKNAIFFPNTSLTNLFVNIVIAAVLTFIGLAVIALIANAILNPGSFSNTGGLV